MLELTDEELLAQSNLNFPQKLYDLMENEHGGSVVQWLSHGYSFRILDAEIFANEIIPKYFKRKFKLISMLPLELLYLLN